MYSEYVVVSYPSVRDVYIDGQIAGKTKDTIRVERGTHRFDLGKPQDYQPKSVELDVKNSTSLHPLPIAVFKPLGGSK
jgi:hypothetical protein